jgi:ATP-dependent exoDNAse (exonuclease V) beta subunit
VKLTPQQQNAVDRRDASLFVQAGAGSGKTSVLVERFVRAALDDGAGADGVLAITFTDKAAAEMKLRIRERFVELGERELARETERAWVSTIHGFCSRVLRAHPLAAGIDPEYRVLDEGEAARLAIQACEYAMEGFLGPDPEPERLELIAAYNPDRLGALVRDFHARQRSRGHVHPRLPVPDGDAAEAVTLRLLADIVERYDERYAALKRKRSGLDFEDLELMARDLLRDDPALRDRYRSRFAHVLVDELQDVNPLQDELIELVSRGPARRQRELPKTGGHLFTVGDELQSIYGFRHADVAVFRRRREEAALAERVQPLTTNFRSRPEILDVIDAAFADVFGESFQALVPPDPDAPRGDARVDLLLVDQNPARWRDTLGEGAFGPAMEGVPAWRAAEARLLARRIEEIVRDDARSYGDVVILLRASSDAATYERALSERGIPTYMAGGGGYWDQQQVSDVRSYLAALANPLDELALYSALSSPLGGVSLDGIVALGLHARDRGVWRVMEEDDLPEMPEADRARLRAFAQRLVAARRDAPRIALEDLIDHAVTESGYDRAVLAMPDGERRMANLRKLMRLARTFEAEEGRDLRGFIDFLDEQRLIRPREGEATLEGEGLGAVRLMTIHMAKGLEFPVVCVADLGRGGREDDALLDVDDQGRISLQLASLEHGLVDSLERAEVREEQKLAGDAEERRIMYVALTRAEERLVISGAADLEKWPAPKPLGVPMDWLWRALAPDLPERVAAGEWSGESRRDWDGRPARVRWTVCTPTTVDNTLPAADRMPAAPVAGGPVQEELLIPPVFAPVASPGSLPVSRLSYSALASYGRCSYRFHLERVAGLHAADPPPGADDAGDTGALMRGTVVHSLLEHMDMLAPVVPDEAAIADAIAAEGGSTDPVGVAAIARLVEAFATSALRTRLAAAKRIRAEVPFAFNLTPDPGGRSLLITGYLDVLATEPGGLLVVDYKSDALQGRDPQELVEQRYAGQRAIYALAALRTGAERVEVSYAFLERPGEVVSAQFSAADAPALERGLADQAEGLLAGRFEPTAEPGRDLCATCPGRVALCSWTEEHTLR